MAHINSQLKEIYDYHWSGLVSAADSLMTAPIKPANPLLIRINEEAYEQSDLRIMYCGQETYGWGGSSKGQSALGAKSVDELAATYEKYFTNGGYKEKELGKRVFWRAVEKFDQALKSAFPDRNVYSIWNNISKIGIADRKGMNAKIRKLERDHFPVFREELALLKPDLVIFMTGPNRDGDISFNLPKPDFFAVSGEIKKRALARVNSSKLTRPALRLYHALEGKCHHDQTKHPVHTRLRLPGRPQWRQAGRAQENR